MKYQKKHLIDFLATYLNAKRDEVAPSVAIDKTYDDRHSSDDWFAWMRAYSKPLCKLIKEWSPFDKKSQAANKLGATAKKSFDELLSGMSESDWNKVGAAMLDKMQNNHLYGWTTKGGKVVGLQEGE